MLADAERGREVMRQKSQKGDGAERAATGRVDRNTLDLRGKTVEESKDSIERFARMLTQENRKVMFILHGHGTGALKTNLRVWLKQRYKAAKSSRPADVADGGDAFTRVELR